MTSGMSQVRPRLRVLVAGSLAAVMWGCLSQNTLFVRGEPFIISGTADVVDRNGACAVWYGENGVTYHLFQGPRVQNADFDRVTTPGVRSRLEIATRSDLVVTCEYGTIVEVERVLEIME